MITFLSIAWEKHLPNDHKCNDYYTNNQEHNAYLISDLLFLLQYYIGSLNIRFNLQLYRRTLLLEKRVILLHSFMIIITQSSNTQPPAQRSNIKLVLYSIL